MKRSIDIQQATEHVAVVRTSTRKHFDAERTETDLVLDLRVSIPIEKLRELPGAPRTPAALALWLEDQRDALLDLLNGDGFNESYVLGWLRTYAEEECANNIDWRVRELEADR